MGSFVTGRLTRNWAAPITSTEVLLANATLGYPVKCSYPDCPWSREGQQGTGPPSLGQEWWGQGLSSYLVAIGAGAVVQLHRILATRPVVLAGAGEAGIALGYNVDVHWPWTAKAQSI